MDENAALDLLAREFGAAVISESPAPVCVGCGEPADWPSPDGHHFCPDCREHVADFYRWRTSWSATDLMEMEFPPLSYAVPGLVPEGLVLLGGKPKVGKSWLALGWAVSVASGGLALSTRPTDRGEVLYIAAEDSPRRLRSRLSMVLGPDEKAPSGLTFETGWQHLDDGGGRTTWKSG